MSISLINGIGVVVYLIIIMIRHLYARTAAKHTAHTAVQQLSALFSSSSPNNGKPPPMKPFVPGEYGLDDSFILTNFTKMKG